VTRLLGGDVAPDVESLLHRRSEGNPFFLEELLRSLLDDGFLIWNGERWEVRVNLGTLLPLVTEAIERRLARLDPIVVDLLRVAAVVGRRCESQLLAQVTGQDAEGIEETLQIATRVRLLITEDDGRYAFTHDLVRETLYAQIGVTRRTRLHQAIGEALESQGEPDSAQRLADLTYHFAEAGDTARGVMYALASGEQAMQSLAAMEAMSYYRTAIQLLGSRAEGNQLAAALTGLGSISLLVGDYAQAAEAYNRA
jgi:predicted ATPase